MPKDPQSQVFGEPYEDYDLSAQADQVRLVQDALASFSRGQMTDKGFKACITAARAASAIMAEAPNAAGKSAETAINTLVARFEAAQRRRALASSVEPGELPQ